MCDNTKPSTLLSLLKQWKGKLTCNGQTCTPEQFVENLEASRLSGPEDVLVADGQASWTINPKICVKQDTCCSGAQVDSRKSIDCEKPIEVLQTNGNPSTQQVRVLGRGVRTTRFPGYTCLVALTARSSDVLVYVNPLTGEGRSVHHGTRFQFRNIAPKPVVRDVSFLNYFVNSREHDPVDSRNVLEPFDTREAADAANIFGSRDCCVKTVLSETGGVWSVNSTIESQ